MVFILANGVHWELSDLLILVIAFYVAHNVPGMRTFVVCDNCWLLWCFEHPLALRIAFPLNYILFGWDSHYASSDHCSTLYSRRSLVCHIDNASLRSTPYWSLVALVNLGWLVMLISAYLLSSLMDSSDIIFNFSELFILPSRYILVRQKKG